MRIGTGGRSNLDPATATDPLSRHWSHIKGTNVVEKTEEEKGQRQLVDLAEGYPDIDTEIVKVGRRFYRVRESILNARPKDYSRCLFNDAPIDRYCVVCAFSLAHPESISPWLAPTEVRCLVHREPNSGKKSTPHCPCCGQPMACVLPVEVTLHQTRFIWICESRHSYLLTETQEGLS